MMKAAPYNVNDITRHMLGSAAQKVLDEIDALLDYVGPTMVQREVAVYPSQWATLDQALQRHHKSFRLEDWVYRGVRFTRLR